jgi:GAF domain-containing protein
VIASDSTFAALSPAIILAKIAALTLQIQQGQSLESLLEWVLADTRNLLQTDRVLIYRFLGEQDAIVSSEAVGAAWHPLLGQRLYDPGFDATWVARYQQGQTTHADVHDGVLAPSSIPLFERLQVQASLVVPLCSQGRLWGCLIVHHCRSPREWQPLERQLLQQMALPLGVAIQQAALQQQESATRQLKQAEPRHHKTEDDRGWLKHDRRAHRAARGLSQPSMSLSRVTTAYGVAVFAVTVALGLTLAFGSWLHATPLQLFFVAVMVSAWYGGRGPGLLATVLSPLAANYCFIEPHTALILTNPRTVVQLGVFMLSALLISQLNESRRLAVRQEQTLRTVSEAAQNEAQAAKERLAVEIALQQSAQAALQRQAERQRLLTTIAQDLRRTLDLDQILQTTVTAVRQFLQTDRVIIYRFAPDWSGTIIAEAVGEGWCSLLGRHITDTYFVSHQGHSAQAGGMTVTNDIYKANLAPCHLALLEQMQVRAALVVPILQGERPWGLLVAQHCCSPRHWAASEIALHQQLTTQIAIAIQQATLYQQAQLALAERQRAETALQQLNQSLEQRVQKRTQTLQQQAEQERLLRTIIQNIHRSFDLEETLAAVLSETRESLQADRVAVYQFHPDWSGSFVAESVGAEWVSLVHPEHPKVWADTHLQATQGGRYQHNETLTVNDIYTIGHSPCHLKLLEQFQARAYVIAPIILDGQLWGLLALYQNSAPREWQLWESSLLQQLGIQMAIALHQAYAYQTAQLQVRELERLHQLKDDFLSTVSHELRTPMSSIKMATQMLEISLQPLGVLDDAANPINRYLKILSEEGKRELALINDLLDLARLDAETEPLTLTTMALQHYIPHVAESFIARTQQQQQHLSFHLPDNLPAFTTDLPYLERILTELLHNACKYTPAGGTITVSAQAMPAALELRVSNTGVEIPATEYERIFTKFYRIPNSDPWKHGGTGLGLALTKKLTECLGGQIHVVSGSGQTTFVLTFKHGSVAVNRAEA